MKTNNLSKLGKNLLAIEFSKDPFNHSQKAPEIVISNNRFDLTQTFCDAEEKVVPIEGSNKFKSLKFYCWGMVMGLHVISFNERKTFVEAIAEIENDTIARMGIMPSHFIVETFISTSDGAKYGHYTGDGSQTSKYEIYYLHPDQREQIDQTVFNNANPMTCETREEFIENHHYFPK
jgi:hypothetical protein